MQTYRFLELFNCLTVSIIIILNTRILVISSYSHSWGQANAFAVPIFDVDLNIRIENKLRDGEKAFADIEYPAKGSLNEYTITSMLALDDSSSDLLSGIEAVILIGGIGFNYTMVRFYSNQVDANLNFVIYGVPKQFISYNTYSY